MYLFSFVTMSCNVIFRRIAESGSFWSVLCRIVFKTYFKFHNLYLILELQFYASKTCSVYSNTLISLSISFWDDQYSFCHRVYITLVIYFLFSFWLPFLFFWYVCLHLYSCGCLLSLFLLCHHLNKNEMNETKINSFKGAVSTALNRELRSF